MTGLAGIGYALLRLAAGSRPHRLLLRHPSSPLIPAETLATARICRNADKPEPPGLVTGLAGIGYALLHLAAASRPHRLLLRHPSSPLIPAETLATARICRNADKPESPGLVTGLAGIGYALLHLAAASRPHRLLLRHPSSPLIPAEILATARICRNADKPESPGLVTGPAGIGYALLHLAAGSRPHRGY